MSFDDTYDVRHRRPKLKPMNEYSTPSWNSDTACLRTLHRHMTDEGWGDWRPAIPLCDYDFGLFGITVSLELPRRPLDLGEGLWR